MWTIDRSEITQAEATRLDEALNRAVEACVGRCLTLAQRGTLSLERRLAYRADMERAADAALGSLPLMECACLWEFLTTLPSRHEAPGGDIVEATRAVLARRLESQPAENPRDAQARLWHLGARHIHGDEPPRAQMLALLEQARADHERLRWYGFRDLKLMPECAPFGS